MFTRFFFVTFLLIALAHWLPAKSIDSLLTILETQRRAGDRLAICEAHLDLAGAYFAQNELELALEQADAGILLVPAEREDLLSHFSYVQYMIFALQWSAYPNEQLLLLDTACFHLEALGDQVLLLGFRPYYADHLTLQGQLVKAKEQYRLLEAYCTEQEGDHSFTLLNAYSRLASILVEQGEFDEAIRYIDLTRKQASQHPIGDNLLATYVEEASIMSKIGEYESIMPILRAGLKLANTVQDLRYIGRFNRLLASYAIGIGPVDSIPIWLDRAKTALHETDNLDEIVEVDLAWVRYAYVQGDFERILQGIQPYLADCKTDAPPGYCRDICYFQVISLDTLGQLDSAVYYAQLGIEISSRFGSPSNLRASYALLAWVQYNQENYQDAYDNLFISQELADTVFRENLETAMADERIRQNVAAAEEAQLVAESRAELLATQNRLWIGLALALAALLLGGGFLLLMLQRARRRLRTTNQELAELNATKDKFFGLIAHDLRSPIVALSGVGGQLQYYLEQNKTDKMSRLANRVEETANSLTALLDNLLQWALLQTGRFPTEPQAVRLSQVVAENQELYRDLADLKNIKLHTDIDEKLTAIADPRALSTIIRNLLNNALKFTPRGGEVFISAQAVNKDSVQLSVRDTGQGIPPEKLDKLFGLEKHSTLGTEGEKGSGLGLVLVQELVKLNGGTIKVRSELEEGSEFEAVFENGRV